MLHQFGEKLSSTCLSRVRETGSLPCFCVFAVSLEFLLVKNEEILFPEDFSSKLPNKQCAPFENFMKRAKPLSIIFLKNLQHYIASHQNKKISIFLLLGASKKKTPLARALKFSKGLKTLFAQISFVSCIFSELKKRWKPF